MATLGTEKEIKTLIAPNSGKTTYSINGQKGLKLCHYGTGGKIFKLHYIDQNGNHATKTIGVWQEKIYGITEAIKDSSLYLKEISEYNALQSNKINNFSELWNLYKEDVLKAQIFKSLPAELLRFEYSLFDLINSVSIEYMNSSRVATPIFLNALKSLQTIGNPKSDTVKKLPNRLNQVFDFIVINSYLENNPTRILSRNFEKNFIKATSIPRKAIADIQKFYQLLY